MVSSRTFLGYKYVEVTMFNRTYPTFALDSKRFEGPFPERKQTMWLAFTLNEVLKVIFSNQMHVLVEGTIAEELGHLTCLDILELERNRLTGTS